MGRKLFVGNLSFNTDERRLEELFQSIGAVDSVNMKGNNLIRMESAPIACPAGTR